MIKHYQAIAFATFAFSLCSQAQPPPAAQTTAGNNATSSTPVENFEKSPWLLAPILQSNPKLGTTFGALAGYMHYFDEKSRPSIFAVQGQYSTTDSIVAGGFARMSFDEDR